MKKVCFCLAMFLGFPCFAYAHNTTNVYVTNNNYNQGTPSNIMCTSRQGICTNGYYMMSTARMQYAPTRSKLKNEKLKERLAENQYSLY